MAIEVKETDGKDGKDLELVVNEDLAEFVDWFRTNVDSEPLTKNELALVKTYVWYKTHPGQKPRG